MSVAVAHAISMNYRGALSMTTDGTVSVNTSESFTFNNLISSTPYKINWGDGTALTDVTSNATQTVNTTHTYTTVGAKTILVRNATDTATIYTTSATVV